LELMSWMHFYFLIQKYSHKTWRGPKHGFWPWKNFQETSNFKNPPIACAIVHLFKFFPTSNKWWTEKIDKSPEEWLVRIFIVRR
jgi:hypothetical protein